MAKKKAAKTAKKAAKKKASGAAAGPPEAVDAPAAEAGSCSDQELQAAGVVASAGELMARIGEAVNAAVQQAVREVFNSLTSGGLERAPASGRILRDEDVARLLNHYREEFQLHDQDVPYLRVVGKVVEVLTVHRAKRRRKDHCSVGEVFLVFLVEIPQHSPYDPNEYRLPKPTRRGNRFAVTRDPGKTMIAGRLQKLKRKGYLTAAGTTRSGGERGYRLSENGRVLFDGWPDVPGLQLDPPSEHE